MKLSIITPFHRGIHFLQDCLESVKEQDLDDFEMILVLDRPEEGYESLLAEYSNFLNIRTVHLPDEDVFQNHLPVVEPENQTEENLAEEDIPVGNAQKGRLFLEEYSGVAAARNIGIEEAQGEYVYFLDSDDYLYRENTLSLLLAKAEETDADVVYGRKAGSWFKRAVFLETYVEPENDTEEEGDSEVGMEDPEVTDGAEEQEESDAEIDQEALEELRRYRRKKKAYRRMMPKLRTASALHAVIRKDLLQKYGIRFQEDSYFYTDTSFVLELLERAAVVHREREAIYVKRKHNDPVNYPAIAQVKSKERFPDMLRAYWYSVKRLEDMPLTPLPEGMERKLELCYSRAHLDRKFMQYYVGVFMKRLRRSKKEAWRTERFGEMRKIACQIDPKLIKQQKHFRKKAMRLLKKGDVDASLRLINRRLAFRKAKKILKNRKEFYRYLYHHWFMNMQMKENWVMCESFLGKNYADSPKYIYEYLQKEYPGKYKFIWSINTKSDIPYKHTAVKRFSLRYYYYLGRCKYFVFNMRQPVWMEKREDSVFLETWHGTPLKKLVFDMEEVYSATPLYKYEVYRQTRQWDYLIAANQFSSEVFRSCFLYDKNMLEFGYPRNDILHAPDRDEKAAAIRRKLGVPEGKKTILYAPTWRDDEYYGKGQYKFTLKLDLPKLREALGDEYVILLRTHYFIADSLDVTGVEDFAINLSKYDDIADIYLISDICITDYSSVFFDYANLKRPILFYTYDIEKYRDMLRGFYIDMEKELPGPLLYTTEEVIDAIKHMDEITARYAERYDEFFERFCGWEDGHASENIAKTVFEL